MTLKKLIPIFILLSATELFGQADEPRYAITFESPNGCTIQLQSFNTEITDKGLEDLMHILHSGALGSGLTNEFPSGVYFAGDTTKSRSYYKKLSDSKYDVFKDNCQKLKSTRIPEQFNELRDSILANYEKRLSYENIVREWIADDNFPTFRSKVVSMIKNKDISLILDSIENRKDFHSKLGIMKFKLFNYLNKIYFPFSDVMATQDRLLEKHHLRFQPDPCDG